MTIKILVLLVGALAASMASCLDQPVGSPYDTRIQTINYNAEDVVEINNMIGTGTQIMLGSDELIQTDKAISGFTDGWALEPRGNSLFIKAVAVKGVDEEGKQMEIEPTPGTWDTNILVTTNKRVYAFDLRLYRNSGNRLRANSKVAYLIKFRYPEEEKRRREASILAEQKKPQLEKVPQVKNANYSMQIGKRSKSIVPGHVFDDGEFTYFMFPGNRAIPAIFSVSEDGSESIVNGHIDPKMPGTVVVHKIDRQFSLRYGKQIVAIYNDTFDETGALNANGTTVPGVTRVSRGEK